MNFFDFSNFSLKIYGLFPKIRAYQLVPFQPLMVGRRSICLSCNLNYKSELIEQRCYVKGFLGFKKVQEVSCTFTFYTFENFFFVALWRFLNNGLWFFSPSNLLDRVIAFLKLYIYCCLEINNIGLIYYKYCQWSHSLVESWKFMIYLTYLKDSCIIHLMNFKVHYSYDIYWRFVNDIY